MNLDESDLQCTKNNTVLIPFRVWDLEWWVDGNFMPPDGLTWSVDITNKPATKIYFMRQAKQMSSLTPKYPCKTWKPPLRSKGQSLKIENKGQENRRRQALHTQAPNLKPAGLVDWSAPLVPQIMGDSKVIPLRLDNPAQIESTCYQLAMRTVV